MRGTVERKHWQHIACEYAPFLILTLAIGGTFAGVATWFFWRATGNASWMNWFFRYPNTALTLAFGTAEVTFCVAAVREFGPKDAMRPGWILLTCAAVAHLAGRTLASLGSGIASTELKDVGTVLGGPIQMILLLFGLGSIARRCARLGFKARIRWIDRVAVLLVMGVTLDTFYGIWRYLMDGKPLTWQVGFGWISDPALLLLLFIALFLRRVAAIMGEGLIANCWRAFAAAIILTSIGDFGLWCVQCVIPDHWTSLSWFVWLLSDAAYALGPAFQVAALARVQLRSSTIQDIPLQLRRLYPLVERAG